MRPASSAIAEISWISPVARALMGKSVGDTAKVPTPKGTEEIEIVEIQYPL